MKDATAVKRESGPGAPGAPVDGSTAVADDVLAARVAAGDDAALETLYGRHGAACYGLARRIVVDATLAQDVVQEVFLAFWRRNTFDPQRGSVSTWLLTITHHKAVDAVRREDRRHSRQTTLEALDSSGAAEPEPLEQVRARLRADEVRAAMSRLPAEQREALLLAYYGGYTQREISAMTGVPLGTIKTRTMAALRKLRDSLPDMPEATGSYGPVDEDTRGSS